MTPVSDGVWKGRGGRGREGGVTLPCQTQTTKYFTQLANSSEGYRYRCSIFITRVFLWRPRDQVCSCRCPSARPKKKEKQKLLLFHPQVFGLIYTFQLNQALGDTMRRRGGGVLKGSLWNRVPVMQQHTGDNLTFDPAALWKWGDYLTGADNNPAAAATSKALKRAWWKEHKRKEGLEKKSLGWYIMKERVQQGRDKKRLDEQV